MTKKKKGTASLIIAMLLIAAAAAVAFYYAGLPKIEDKKQKKQWEGMDILEKYRENPDMAGWIQVEGTDINYPVMNGSGYLYRDFDGESSSSGSIFTEDGWTPESPCSLLYGHNMWMIGTMFNPLHEFEEEDFFSQNTKIKFYVISGDGASAEKRTYEITHVIKTDVGEWNYPDCVNIADSEDMALFLSECESRALYQRTAELPEDLIVLSTCSYHIKGKDGRLVVVGRLTERTGQTRLDAMNDWN